MSEYLPEIVEPPPEPEIYYEPTEDKDPNEPVNYDLKKKLDTDKVFKKKLTKMALSNNADPMDDKIPTITMDIKEIADPIEVKEEEVIEGGREDDIIQEKEDDEQEAIDHLIKEEIGYKEEEVKYYKSGPRKGQVKPKRQGGSAAQLAGLAKGRASSLAKRQAKKRLKEFEGKIVSFSEEPPPPPVIKPQPVKPTVSKNDIRDIMLSAISQYDEDRKIKKQLKKEAKAKEISDARLTQQINRVLNPSDPDYFSECFTFS